MISTRGLNLTAVRQVRKIICGHFHILINKHMTKFMVFFFINELLKIIKYRMSFSVIF